MTTLSLLVAATTLTVASVSQNARTRAVTVRYSLSGDPAVVTIGSVTTNGAAMAETDLTVVAGDANRLVQPGEGYELVWQPSQELILGPFPANGFEIALKAWATNAPPDYMVLDLDQQDRGLRYYTCAAAVPGGVTDRRYKTKNLLFRRIPAAGVVWRMGSPTDETGRTSGSEYTHYVKLTNDYYLAVYETTRKQFRLLNNGSDIMTQRAASFGSKATYTYVQYGIDDWDHPETDVSYVPCRSRCHASTCTADADTVFKNWPQHGHELNTESVTCPTCKSSMGSRPFLQTMRVKSGGLPFDLPTDAQWEFACRGGSETYEMRPGELDRVAWYRLNSSNDTQIAEFPRTALPHRVGLKEPNGYGLYDMLGNLGEWCLDWYSALPNSSDVAVEPQGPTFESKRIDSNPAAGQSICYRAYRGGTFYAKASDIRSARRIEKAHAYYSNTTFYPNDNASAIAECSSGLRLCLPAVAFR